MSTRMLIDARHPEETRVVVQRGNKVEDFDFESAAKRQLKGNIYLAKVTRVEPSLQAAFVDYGGNRHGFLAFSEIHPDYYQIPVEDREALLREEAEELAAAEEEPSAERQAAGEAEPAANEDDNGEGNGGEPEAAETVADGGGHEEEEALRRNRRNLRRRYKIQEVIKRRQILLVQVVKEERGNKGAALTTYLSLAGRYCVLMPNSTHGGGISRKISTVKDRRRLRTIMADLAIPEGMGCIIRTAGLERTKAEIKRDFDYLLRLWDGIRELTLQSAAPCLTYEEGDLIKRSIRDLYNKDIDEILVEGDEGYKAAKSFMRLLMPSHAKKVKQYKDRTPLFHRYKVEAALETMYSPVVQLKSGGYIVLNATEALVAIDVNSGRSTREHNIEETALSTNLEAAAEVARQLRMRDLAGLIVIDFIDMEDRQNIRAVERRLRDALKVDRARVQVGRISSFGLLEMSRQRLHPGLLEASTHVCPTCKGSGAVRSVHSSALHALRALEDEALKGRASHIAITLQTDVALYLLNQKRDSLRDLEQLYNIRIEVAADPSVIAPEYLIEHSGPPPQAAAPGAEAVTLGAPPAAEPEAEAEDEDEEAQAEETAGAADEERATKKRRRRGRRGGRGRKAKEAEGGRADEQAPTADPKEATADQPQGPEAKAEDAAKRRRRGRRGGRGRKARESGAPATPAEPQENAAPAAAEASAMPEASPPPESVAKAASDAIAQAPVEPAPTLPSVESAAASSAPLPEHREAETPVQPQRRGWWQRAVGK